MASQSSDREIPHCDNSGSAERDPSDGGLDPEVRESSGEILEYPDYEHGNSPASPLGEEPLDEGNASDLPASSAAERDSVSRDPGQGSTRDADHGISDGEEGEVAVPVRSWVVINRVISPLIWLITIVTLLITPVITTHETPSRVISTLAGVSLLLVLFVTCLRSPRTFQQQIYLIYNPAQQYFASI